MATDLTLKSFKFNLFSKYNKNFNEFKTTFIRFNLEIIFKLCSTFLLNVKIANCKYNIAKFTI